MFSAPTHKQQHQPQAWPGRVIRVHDSCLRRWPSSSRLPENTQPKTTEQGLRESQCAVISKVRNIAKKTDQVYPSSNRCFTEMQNNFTFSRLQKDCTTGSFTLSEQVSWGLGMARPTSHPARCPRLGPASGRPSVTGIYSRDSKFTGRFPRVLPSLL